MSGYVEAIGIAPRCVSKEKAMSEIEAHLEAIERLSHAIYDTLDSVPAWQYDVRLLAPTAVVTAEYDRILAEIESEGPDVKSTVRGLLDILQNNLNATIDELLGGGHD